jgi:DNA-binding transcriptional MerR regulator
VADSRVDMSVRGARPAPSARTDEGFRGAQVCSLVGITYRQLDYWARTGLLRPSITDATGSGSQRRYSYGDVLELKVIKRLLDAGLKLQQARQAVECLRGDLGADLASAQLVLAGSRSVLAHSDGEIVDLLAGGQGVFNILPLSAVVSELDAAIVEIDSDSAADRPERPDRHPAAGYLAAAVEAGEAVER